MIDDVRVVRSQWWVSRMKNECLMFMFMSCSSQHLNPPYSSLSPYIFWHFHSMTVKVVQWRQSSLLHQHLTSVPHEKGFRLTVCAWEWHQHSFTECLCVKMKVKWHFWGISQHGLWCVDMKVWFYSVFIWSSIGGLIICSIFGEHKKFFIQCLCWFCM